MIFEQLIELDVKQRQAMASVPNSVCVHDLEELRRVIEKVCAVYPAEIVRPFSIMGLLTTEDKAVPWGKFRVHDDQDTLLYEGLIDDNSYQPLDIYRNLL